MKIYYQYQCASICDNMSIGFLKMIFCNQYGLFTIKMLIIHKIDATNGQKRSIIRKRIVK